ncbi:autotransporter domain-containing protein [Maritimibacter sp. DP07]|uniref:Autotransporter domain-containing protein n=1 Tax=Maritimibacter harenae TaxID=2606218 RepID=A0A845LXX4_9RHOB|nr:autotransporter outer membrane beta-barrel domain-containing protein [Maritimibacter harenae]MZR11629.1 autotransporter domain-containing protein [Maritimibacter harenae]
MSGTALACISGMALAEAPGSDSYGNSITSSKFDPTIPTDLFHDIAGTGTHLVFGDDVSARNVSLGGLVFPFYGTDYTNLTFATNGYISTSSIDYGPDLSNDAVLPTAPSTGSGARIYPYHDDTVANVYGQYFDQASSPIGTETYVAQWNAVHFAGAGTTDDNAPLRYNVMLLRDGTIVMAYDRVSAEAGARATVGIQNGTYTDGVAYLANEQVMTDGMTILVTSPTSARNPLNPFEGMANDQQITGSEIGLMQTGTQSDLTTEQVRKAFAYGQQVERMSTKGSGDLGTGDRFSTWATASAVTTTGNAGPAMTGVTHGFHVGGDYRLTPEFLGGLSFAYTQSSLQTGKLATSATGYTVSPYVGYEINDNLLVTASANYTRTTYDSVTMPLGTFTSASNRFSGELTVEGRVALGQPGLSIVPQASVAAGKEFYEPLTGMGQSITVQPSWFVRGEATARLEQSFTTPEGSGAFYALAGMDYVRTNGDNSIALFATAYDNSRLGGVVGAGFSFTAPNGINVDASFSGRGLGTTNRSAQGNLTVGLTF